MRILRDGGAGDGGGAGGGGGGTFLATLPEDLRTEPSLATFKDVGGLAKSYVSAQKMIGTKRLAIPEKTWSDAQWNDFYSQAGRPETPDKYELPDIKMEEGLAIDEKKRSTVLQHFHKLGLNTSQARGVMEYYMNSLNEGAKAQATERATTVTQAQVALKQEWGDQYDAKIDLAKAVVRKFGGEDFGKYLDESGQGNNPQLIRMLSKVGAMIAEDTTRGGGADFNITDRTRATQEIETLKLDKEFQAALGLAQHPGHRAAVDRWMSLFRVAYPGKQQEDAG